MQALIDVMELSDLMACEPCLINLSPCHLPRLGIQTEAKLVIGIPMLTSLRSLRFWLRLCGAEAHEGAPEQLRRFGSEEAKGADAMRSFCNAHTADLVHRVTPQPPQCTPCLHHML